MIPDSLKDFKSIFDRFFWRAITKKTLIPLGGEPDKNKTLESLYKKIIDRKYSPSKSRATILINKGNSVARAVPIFELEDSCVYFFCIKKIESYIAINRVPNTYGGWTLGGVLREKEEQEILNIKKHIKEYEAPDGQIIVMDDSEEYAIESSFNPMAWQAQWKDFYTKLYLHFSKGGHDWAVEMDIANFYDSIRLDILESKIRKVVPKKDHVYVDLLFIFLKGINSVGIPQDETADCSRILANFYLEEYDKEMSLNCEVLGGKYFRYADDQVVFANDQGVIRSLVCLASLNLIGIGLSINQKKVNILNREAFELYYAFDWFIKYGELVDGPVVDEMINEYFRGRDQIRNNGISLFLRIINILSLDVSPNNISLILKEITRVDILECPKMKANYLFRIYQVLDDEQKEYFVLKLIETSENSIHNSFHYNLLKFFNLIGHDTASINNRIRQIDFYSQVLKD